MLKNISVKTGLITMLGVSAALLLLVSALGINAVVQSSRALRTIDQIQGQEASALTNSYNATLRARVAAALAVRQMEIGLLEEGAQSTGRASAFLLQAEEQMQRFVNIGTLRERGHMLSQKLMVSYHDYLDQGIKPMLAAIKRGDLDAYYGLLEQHLTRLSGAFDKDLSEFREYAREIGEQEIVAANAQVDRQLTAMAFAAIVALLLGILSWFALRRIILHPLENTIQQLELIAAGDLSQQIEDERGAEMGRLVRALQQMQRSLTSSVSRVRDVGGQIGIGVQELAAGHEHLAQRTEESAASLEQTAASMEQLTATVQRNADNAEQAHARAKGVSDTADKGSEVMCYVIEKMQAIAHSANRIGDILSVIDGIAFQTNILALNAAVEAARAGEQGRGFAVVAGEVRNLAQRSAEAAKEIKTLILDSQSRVKEGSAMAHTAGETMDEITNEVMQVTALMHEISAASREQSSGIGQVNQAVTQMDAVAQQNAALVEQASAATRTLEQQVALLVQNMAVFTLRTE